jgi:hypothetical protein
MLQRFSALTTLLGDHADLWRPLPFVHHDLPWQAQLPELAAWLDALPEAALDDPTDAWLHDAPVWLRELARTLQHLSSWPALATERTPVLGAYAARRIPGRKVRQIEGFCATVAPRLPPGGEVVDWCSGKSHLGRTLAQRTGSRLLALEIDAALVRSGQRECDHLGLDARFVQADVREVEVAARLVSTHWVAALHACGDLHAALLRAAVERQVAGVALAPCCYNRVESVESCVLSARGRAANLRLGASDLDLVHREPLVASGTDRARSLHEQAWRLGFDALQREVTGRDAYRTMPPFPRPWLRLGFPEFCRAFAALDGLELPVERSWAAWEAQGWLRLAQVRRRDRLRGLFRAPLEAWLVLDRAQVLVEAGFTVEIGQFCPRTVTPRNALILGWR